MTHFSKTTARVRRAATATAALLLAGALPVQAAQAAPRPHVRAKQSGWLYVTVARGESGLGGIQGALLQCDPPRGYDYAKEACADLTAVDGDIRAIPRKHMICPMVYMPVTAQARGQWEGRVVNYSETFANDCVMQAQTGDVFTLDA
ncbi:SSI family serine proteinase inhibitor [Streptomyces sp. NPDC046985]|uniref:SSI family serine proteinase inhibitor n=1 Tax=Streptomyces sp. NPDC046985 TaxID=3155377 RepID=UPI0033F8A81B